MSRTFIVEPLRQHEIDLVYPIIRAAAPEIGREEWMARATPLVRADEAKQRGIIGLKEGNGYFCGLFTYLTMDTLSNGRILLAENLIAQELIGSGSTEKQLLRATEDLAKKLQCQFMRASLPVEAISQPPRLLDASPRGGSGLMEIQCPQRRLLRLMRECGMVPGTVGLEKQIVPPPKLELVDADP